jgi:uncharacterized protein YceH (UPF0502 family)
METGSLVLTAAEARVLGALVEKEVTTPEYYPLSLNALMNACNQRSNREPVMSLDEDEVRQAVHGLQAKNLAGAARSDGRVAKYEHHIGEVFNFTRAESALMCVLLLRGPQTPGELRGRTERLHSFDELTDVLAGLQKLMDREPALVALLPRQPGAREARYAQLLTGPVDMTALPQPTREHATSAPVDDERLTQLETALAELRKENAELRQQMEALTLKIDNLFG